MNIIRRPHDMAYVKKTVYYGMTSRNSRRIIPVIGARSCNLYDRIKFLSPDSWHIYITRRAYSSHAERSNDMPLSSIRVLELGQIVAGPFAGQLLGWVEHALIVRSHSLLIVSGSLGPKSLRLNHRKAETHFAFGGNWMSTVPVLGFEALDVTRKVWLSTLRNLKVESRWF